jgi:hypothetical protein
MVQYSLCSNIGCGPKITKITKLTLIQALTFLKEIEVSHWGNIYVEEKYELVSNSVFISICPNREIRWLFLVKFLKLGICSYFGVDSAT